MTHFSDVAEALIAELPDRPRREALWRTYVETGMPTTTDEVWRYAPLSSLDIDRYDPSSSGEPDGALVPAGIGAGPGAHIEVTNGQLTSSRAVPEGVSISLEPTGTAFIGRSPEERYGSDAFALIAAALTPGIVTITVADGVSVAEPVTIVQRVDVTAAFLSTRVVVGQNASVEVVEVLVGARDGLVSTIGEYEVGPSAHLTLSSYQRLDMTAWHVARTTTVIDRDASVHQGVVGLGAAYDRCRNDAEMRGTGAHNELRTTYFGSADQVHDFRTHQLHLAARSTSKLLSKGVVADVSRSVYTGLIEIERGARRTDARQTNHNLILSPHAHADTVPNLDIRENDVACAHASSVGPLDEMQLWYIESRGVERSVAQRLLVQGFFREMTAEMPAALAAAVDADVAATLARTGVGL